MAAYTLTVANFTVANLMTPPLVAAASALAPNSYISLATTVPRQYPGITVEPFDSLRQVFVPEAVVAPRTPSGRAIRVRE